MWQATVLTIFPDLFPGPLAASLAGRALERRGWTLDAVDIRAFATDRHRSTDDTPAGGGPGMVMKPDVLARALDALSVDERPRLLMSPRGLPLTQARIEQLAAGPGVVVACGRFEGVDERVIAGRALVEISIGDFVLSGGEIAALALIDACVRLLPGVIGKQLSTVEESFAGGLLEYPQYTRPQIWEGRAIPEVLLSGDHARIAAFRRNEAERLTRERRPDLWAAYAAVQGDRQMTNEWHCRIGGSDRSNPTIEPDVPQRAQSAGRPADGESQ
jgi:tRNA (guanine37-N1)-methyltransferase